MVLVVGATGQLGGAITQMLLAQGSDLARPERVGQRRRPSPGSMRSASVLRSRAFRR
jgi:uncharacterized protein YbjT (DUF2867 family)